MRCLNCRKNAIANDIEVCLHCNVYLPALFRDVLNQNTILHNNSYKIDYPLGRGGFGITYRARHINLEEIVAIKEFYPNDCALRNNSTNTLMIPTPQQKTFQRNLERFKREGKILRKLRHPNIVEVMDLFEANGTAYLVMELLDGHTLRDELDAQAKHFFSVEQVKAFINKIVEALDVVHQAGVYHLDIKPDNVMVTKEGRIVLVDFGAAKQSVSSNSQSTRSYTQDYAAPEVMSKKEVGAESDIFELGMMVYELLKGKRPPNAMERLLEGQFSWEAEGVNSPWKELIEEALELKKEKRPKSIKEWWKQIEISSVMVTSQPISTFDFETVKLDKKGNIEARSKKQGKQYIEDLGNGIKLEMVEIPSGNFMMGTNAGDIEKVVTERKRYYNKEEEIRRWVGWETPQHEVRVATFYMGKYQVTQEQWQRVMGNNPSHFKGDDKLPVESVSWNDVVEFCKKLSEKTGNKYRLPSEAEWEYACRAGSNTAFASGETMNPEIVNYNGKYPYGEAAEGEYRGKTTVVGRLGVANEYGLYDMHGNVWEWCQDTFQDSYKDAPVDGSAREILSSNKTYRVLRGGSCNDFAYFCRSAVRYWLTPVRRALVYGFRIVVEFARTLK